MNNVSHWDDFCSTLARYSYSAEGLGVLQGRSKFNIASGLRLVCIDARKERCWSTSRLREIWRATHCKNCHLLLLLVFRGEGKGQLCFDRVDNNSPSFIVSSDLVRLTAVCERALAEDVYLAVSDRLETAFEALGKARKEAFLGLHHGELFSRHYMEKRSWKHALLREKSLPEILQTLKAGVEECGIPLLKQLGFEVVEGKKHTHGVGREVVLRSGCKDRVFGLLLGSDEGIEYPIAGLDENEKAWERAIRIAKDERLPFAMVISKDILRLYVRQSFGKNEVVDDYDVPGDFSGERYLEVDVKLAKQVWRFGEKILGEKIFGEKVQQEQNEKDTESYAAGLRALAMLFSAAALSKGGVLVSLVEQSRSYVDSVAESLRRRIYRDVMPKLAEGLVAARGISQLNHTKLREELDETYKMAMRVLFRLLFVAYAEDKGLIPSAEDGQENAEQQRQKDLLQAREAYQKRSLKSKAEELSREFLRERSQESQNRSQTLERGQASDKPSNDRHWKEVGILFDAIDKGDEHMGLPAYNGGLFVKQEWERDIVLTDDVFAQILQLLLLETEGEGAHDPVDFADLQVRELGTIYEGLLESELSRADEDLTTEGKNETLRPLKGAKKGSKIVVAAGDIYVHNTSGERKSTGSYYTPAFCVEHLLDEGLEPALKAHFVRLDALLEEQGEIGSETFFDLRVADIAMGSGHFLVAAAERMAKRFTDYYRQHRERLCEVAEGLERLRTTAEERLRAVDAPVPLSLLKREKGQHEGRHEGRGTSEKKRTKEEEREQDGEMMLLRRLVVSRCLYGVDRNDLAVQLARISLWIHSFVPGLPLSYLDRNLICGDSLTGVGTVAELEAKVRAEGSMFKATAEEFLGDAKESLRLLSGNLQASVMEVKAAAAANEAIAKTLQPTQAWCDVMTAVRINPHQLNVHSSNWRTEKENLFGSDRHKKAQQTLQGLEPIHFPVAFPEVFLRERQGFDVILGNPPWDKIFVDEGIFWTRYISGFKGYPQNERIELVKQYKKDYPALVDLLKQEKDKQQRMLTVLNKSVYGEEGKGFGSGHPDLHKVFAWRYWQLLVAPQGKHKEGEQNKGGHLGAVFPRSLSNTEGSQGFRKTIFQSAEKISIVSIINKNNWCFADLHPQFVVTLLTLHKNSESTDTKIYLRGPYNNQKSFDKRAEEVADVFKGTQISTWSEAATLPNLPTAESPAVFQQLRLSPSLNHDDGETWRARPYQELNATTDQPLMDIKAQEQLKDTWPVYKGRSFNLWQPDTEQYYFRAKPQAVLDRLQNKRLRGANSKNSPFSEFHKKDIARPETLPCLSPRISFRLVTRATDTRTMICCLIPPKVFCQNSAPYFLFPRGDERDQTYLLGILCSRPLDWYARRFVELNMNHHIINSLPIPRPIASDPLRLRVIELAGRLACQDKRLHHWAESIGVPYDRPLTSQEKNDMTCELDAVAAHLYGLSRSQLTHIFATFHEGWKDYEKTLQPTLVHYDIWRKKLSRPTKTP